MAKKEILRPADVKAIEATQQWIEGDIIGRNYCPPMRILAGRHKRPDGTINWDELGKEVDISSYVTVKPGDALVEKVTDRYQSFVKHATQGSAPLTQVTILPDFQNNSQLDRMLFDVYTNSVDYFSRNNKGKRIARMAFGKGLELQRPELENAEVVRAFEDQETAAQVVGGLFERVIFYGKKLREIDLIGFESTRGNVKRQRVLSRAPYSMIQVVNPFAGRDLSARLNRPALHQRNTRQALALDLDENEARMNAYRNDEIVDL